MARIIFNRSSFAAGVLSKRALANSNSEMYNYALTLGRNCIIDILGGAYKRQGSRFVQVLDSDRVKLVEFLCAQGKSCIAMFTEDGVWFFEYKPLTRTVRKFFMEDLKLGYDDFKELKYFQREHRLFFWVNSAKCFYVIETDSYENFEFTFSTGYNLTPEPKAPLTPSMLLHVSLSSAAKTVSALNESGDVIHGIFTDADVGRKITFKYREKTNSGQSVVYWPEAEIISVADDVAAIQFTAASYIPEAAKSSQGTTTNIREWFISAIGVKGRMGNPSAMSMFQGRLYMAKESYVFASKRTEWPLCFAYGPDEDDGFVAMPSSGNMAGILWMYPVEKLIVGSENGIYLIGNTAQFAEPITAYNFIPVKIGSMGCNSLMPIDAEGDLIFIGTDNRSVYELGITQDGGYVLSQINKISTDLAKTGIIDHAWQQYPRKQYWAVTNDGSLLCCSYDKEEGRRSWSDSVLGGDRAYVLQVESTSESNTDLLWLLVRRETSKGTLITIEYLPKPFDPEEEEIFEQQYTDSGVLLQNRHNIVDIVNSEPFHVGMHMTVADRMTKYINTTGRLLIALLDEKGQNVKTIYENTKKDLSYIGLSEQGFFISAFDNGFTISEKSKARLENSYYAFETSIIVTKIVNENTMDGKHYVRIQTNAPETYDQMKQGMFIVLRNTGFKGLDNVPFRIRNVSPSGFRLADMSNHRIDLKLEGELNDNAELFCGKILKPDMLSCQDGYIIFGENIFNETIDNAVLHTARLAQIKGATDYNGSEYNLKLIESGEDSWKYGLYHDEPDEEGIIYTANSSDFGTYDKLLETNGYAYFYFQFVAKKDIKHLIGQEVCYTINGNWPYSKVFVLEEDMFSDNDLFRLYRPSASTDFGLPYRYEIETTDLAGGSLFGSSEGSVGTQTSVVLTVYASLGGQYGPCQPEDERDAKNILQDIKYPFTGVVDRETPLVSASIKMPLSNGREVTGRKVYVRHDEPLSFNVLSIVQDVTVSDG